MPIIAHMSVTRTADYFIYCYQYSQHWLHSSFSVGYHIRLTKDCLNTSFYFLACAFMKYLFCFKGEYKARPLYTATYFIHQNYYKLHF